MSAAGIACMRGASRSRLALAAFSTNCRGVSGLLSYPTAAAASPSSSGPFLYGNRRGQVLHISQFVEANGMRVDTLALVRRMGVPSKHLVHEGTGGRSSVRTLAAGMRGASRSRLAIAAFSTNRRSVNSLISYPAAAAALPSSSGLFLYGNRRGQVLHISQFVEVNGMRVDTLALVRRMEAQGVPLKQAEAIMLVITEVLKDKGGMLKSEMISDANLSKLYSQVRSTEYSNARSQLNAINRKQTGRSRRCFSSASGPAPLLPSSGGKGEIFIDTNYIVKRIMDEGVSAEVAGLITSIVMETVNDSFDLSKLYASQSMMQKNHMDLQSSQELEIQLLRADIQKMRAEIEKKIYEVKMDISRYALGFLASLCTAAIAWFLCFFFPQL